MQCFLLKISQFSINTFLHIIRFEYSHEGLIPDWKSDYAEMYDHFIYGTKLSFAELIDRMKELQERFRKIK